MAVAHFINICCLWCRSNCPVQPITMIFWHEPKTNKITNVISKPNILTYDWKKHWFRRNLLLFLLYMGQSEKHAKNILKCFSNQNLFSVCVFQECVCCVRTPASVFSHLFVALITTSHGFRGWLTDCVRHSGHPSARWMMWPIMIFPLCQFFQV